MKPVVTLADIAREAEVSLQTVSRTLNTKGEIDATTRGNILAIAERLGYWRNGIARGLATYRTMTLGLALPNIAGMVRVDDAAGTRQAIAHLLATQRTSIGFLAGPPHTHSSQSRTHAYRAALTTAHMAVDPTLLQSCSPDVRGGYQAATEMLTAYPSLQALLCYNDLVAVGALQASASLGLRVPDDLAIVGCDDILLAGLVTPALTTLHVSKLAIGAAALRLLLDRIAGTNTQENVVFAPQLVVRASAP